MSVSGEPSSPFYPFGGGVALTIITVFILGFLATRAEPALNVLGKTVEKLSEGAFSRKLLVYSVCVGVAVGMSAGACKILFGASLIGFILGKYFAALALVLFAILPTVLYYYTVYQLGLPKGNLDAGAILGSYLGLFLLAAIFAAAR